MDRGRPARPAAGSGPSSGSIASRLLLAALLCGAAAPAASLHLIGCLYEDLCEDTERCFNDGAFGHCVPHFATPDQLIRLRLSHDDLAELATVLESLVTRGHRWSHVYTQCVLQTKLLSLQTGEPLDASVCELVNGHPDGWLPHPLPLPFGSHGVAALPADDADPRPPAPDRPDRPDRPDPQTYDKNDADGHAVFGPDDKQPPNADTADTYRRSDETLILDDDRQKLPPSELLWLPENGPLPDDLERPLVAVSGRGEPIMKRTRPEAAWSPLDDAGDDPAVSTEQLRQLLRLIDEVETLADLQAVRSLLDRQRDAWTDADSDQWNGAMSGRRAGAWSGEEKRGDGSWRRMDVLNDRDEKPADDGGGWRPQGRDEKRQLWAPPAPPGDAALHSLERAAAADRRRQRALQEALLPEDAELVLDYDDTEPADEYLDMDMDMYDAAPIPLSVRSDPEFRRAERLDIKKPGPWFGVNNYAFDYDFDGKSPTLDEFRAMDQLPMEPMEPVEPMEPMEPLDGATLEPEPVAGAVELEQPARLDPALAVADESRRVDAVAIDDVTARSDVTPVAQATPPADPARPLTKLQEGRRLGEDAPGADRFGTYPDPRDTIDASYVFVRVEKPFQRWTDGRRLVEQLEQRLALPPHTLDDIRVKGDLVTFRVNRNPLHYNSTTVVAKLGDVRGPLESRLGVALVETGQGDGSGGEGASSVLLAPAPHTLLIQTLSIVLGVLAAVVLLVLVVVFALRRNGAAAKDKAKQLAGGDAEAASRDYQDLCRSRMAARVSDKEQTSEKPQRVHSLSKESDGTASPTSRSSTSSWSEEPVTSNMDISTGHMVLSYMEDHLKRKDKLEQEWRALCAYEAEPSARTVATLPENIDKNRCPEVLAYDHSRVSLSAVTNATGGNYINASSITDHDPRNPAYIATQGPLASTANDFWQMVWEQGSVVIVMLTRLAENGAQMCHRYWPEEGSELYHIYEVHLVSEHIWCDEYLVRSFYLKNLKTSETRTVTQFHFLAWPDNGVPTSTKALLEFRRKVNKSYRGRSCPVIVHCSDGAGRTGTYCLIDMVLNRMSKGAKEIDIAASLEHIRDQRPLMVRTRAQFEFVLMAVAEEVHAILKALPQ